MFGSLRPPRHILRGGIDRLLGRRPALGIHCWHEQVWISGCTLSARQRGRPWLTDAGKEAGGRESDLALGTGSFKTVSIPLPKNFVVDDEPENRASLAQRITTCLDETVLTGARVHMNVGLSAVRCFEFDLGLPHKRELHPANPRLMSLVARALSEQQAMPLADHFIDFWIIPGTPAKLAVWTCSRREVLDRIALSERLKTHLISVEPQSHSLLRALSRIAPGVQKQLLHQNWQLVLPVAQGTNVWSIQGPLPFGFEVVDPKRQGPLPFGTEADDSKRQGPLPFGTEADDSEHQGPRKIHRYALNAGARICANTSRPLIALEDLPGSAWPLAQDGAALDQAGLLFSLGLVGPH